MELLCLFCFCYELRDLCVCLFFNRDEEKFNAISPDIYSSIIQHKKNIICLLLADNIYKVRLIFRIHDLPRGSILTVHSADCASSRHPIADLFSFFSFLWTKNDSLICSKIIYVLFIDLKYHVKSKLIIFHKIIDDKIIFPLIFWENKIRLREYN